MLDKALPSSLPHPVSLTNRAAGSYPACSLTWRMNWPMQGAGLVGCKRKNADVGRNRVAGQPPGALRPVCGRRWPVRSGASPRRPQPPPRGRVDRPRHLRRHADDLCLYVLEGTLNVRVPDNDGPCWFEVCPDDGFYLPERVPYQFFNGLDETARFVFGVAPDYRG